MLFEDGNEALKISSKFVYDSYNYDGYEKCCDIFNVF